MRDRLKINKASGRLIVLPAVILICVALLVASAMSATASARPQSEMPLSPDQFEIGVDSVALESDSVYDEQFDSVPPITGVQNLEIKVSPVDIDRDKPQQPVMHYYDRHGNELQTPVRFLTELDTVTHVKAGPKYPAYNGVSVGVNIFDPIMMLVGQRRLNIDVSASVSLFNWFFPVVELGMGYADANPEDGRCHIKVKPTLYGKLGFNYNFVYKSNPDYQVFFGFRAGLADFSYTVTDIKAGSDYYDIAHGADLTDVHTTCWYGQIVAGVNVKIYKCFSMGWTGRYGFKFKTTSSREGVEPWYVPGFGAGPMTATYSLIFTI